MHPRPGLTRIVQDGIERLLGRWSVTVNISGDEHAYALQRLGLPLARTANITNGIDTSHFRPCSADEKTALRRRLGLPERARILGTLGRAVPQKDPMTTYEAFAAALACDPDLYLLHVGRGELDRRLDRFVARRWLVGHVIRLPYLSNPVDFYRAIDGFILTSLYEGMSLAVLEAMSCNLPLILSDAPGNRELQKLPLTHLWSAPIGNVSAFARAILLWSTKNQTSCNHRACAVQHFDSLDTHTNILSLYDRLQPAAWPDHHPLPELTSSSSGPRQALG
jgi:glycosyltransferase involved in cell wall biosynthesis